MNIRESIEKFGAKSVYDAAAAHMAGDTEALLAVGLSAKTIGDANRIMTDAFAKLGVEDRAKDYSDTIDELGKHGGAREGSGRKPVASETVMKSVKLTPEQWEHAREIGEGNAARGIRRALDAWKT